VIYQDGQQTAEKASQKWAEEATAMVEKFHHR
jgi:hypothetical protein